MLYIDSTVLRTRLGGHLWWRRWSEPREAAVVHVEYPEGRWEDHLLDGDVLDREIATWTLGEFRDAPRSAAYQLTWLDDAESARAWEVFDDE